MWIERECSKLENQSKQAKLQMLQYLSQNDADNLNNVRCETSRISRKTVNFLTDKVERQ